MGYIKFNKNFSYGIILIFILFLPSILFQNSTPTGSIFFSPSTSPTNNLLQNNSPNFNKFDTKLQNFMQLNSNDNLKYNSSIILYSNTNTRLINQTYPIAKISGRYLHFIPSPTLSQLRQFAVDSNIIFVRTDNKVSFTSLNQTSGQIPSNSFVSDQIIQANQAWNKYNITGKGVTLGIIDSGIDFGATDLSSSMKKLPNGYSASFDGSGFGFAIAPLVVHSIQENGKTVLPLQNKTITFWLGEAASASRLYGNTTDLGIQLNNLDISSITKPSVSNTYHVGISYQPGVTQEVPTQIFLFVLTDSKTSGVYDTLYCDLDTSLGLTLAYNGIIFETGSQYLSLVDWSLNNDQPFGANNPIIAADINGDGINDVSMGTLATTFNRLQLVLPGKGLIQGIDPSGAAISILYDAVGHGTLVAGAAASRGLTSFRLFDNATTSVVENATTHQLPGSAPGADIISTKGYTISDFIYGWLWAAGVEPDNNLQFGPVNTDHVANIMSNSWGNSIIGDNGQLKGFDFYSLFLDLMSAPNLLYTGYPGMIFVVASGNGGSGYGTVATPGAASMAITVGASNNYIFKDNPGRRGVAWFSDRGPTPYGLVKPDVVAPGNIGYTDYQVVRGYGNGTYAAGLFGGTSEATPRAAGVIALIYQALKQKGYPTNLGTIRTVLKSAAVNTGFDQFAQGAGLINALNAMKIIFNNSIPIISSNSSAIIAGNRLNAAFGKYFIDQNNLPLEHPLKTSLEADSFLYIDPSNPTLSFQVKYLNGTVLNSTTFTPKITQLTQQSSTDFTFKSTNSNVTTVNLGSILPVNFGSMDLIQISLSLTNSSWTEMLNNGLKTPEMILYDSLSHHIVYDSVVQEGWSQQLYSGKPIYDFSGYPTLQFTDPGYANQVPNWLPLQYNGKALLYYYSSTNAITSLSNSSGIYLNYTRNNPIFESFNFQLLNSTNQPIATTPVIIAKTEAVQFGNKASAVDNSSTEITPYSLTSTYGTFDWGYRPESGDFRYYRLSVPSNATYLVLQGIWNDLGLIPDFYLFNSTGNLIKTSDVTYIGGGTYDSTTSEKLRQNLLIPVKDNVYTLLVHFAQTPFEPGHIKFYLFTRYLTLNPITSPISTFSQNLNNPISGNLKISALNYTVSQFPELKISKTNVQVYQGENGTYQNSIPNSNLKPGVPTSISDVEDFYVLNLQKGEKVNLKLIWNGTLDADMYVIGPNDPNQLKYDLLKFQATTPGTGFESASFAADVSGPYTVYIDFVASQNPNTDFNFKLIYDTRQGPTISNNGNSVNIDTSYFPNDQFGLKIIYDTNFGISFNEYKEASFKNHNMFTGSILSPSNGSKISGDVNVQWNANKTVSADVFLIKDGVSYQVATSVTGNSVKFNSRLYSNGPATIIVRLTDQVYVLELTIQVQLNNIYTSTLPPINTSSKSLPFFSIIDVLIISISFGLYYERRKMLNK